MLSTTRTSSDNPDFRELVRALDQDLALRDGADHSFYAQFNKIDHLQHTIVAYENETPVGCGAIKAFSADAMEVKRMFVPVGKRGQGVASAVLAALEKWAKELGYKKCVLETGKRQPEAIGLYKKNGYVLTSNYGQYIGVENSVCFEKTI
jgi:GNAT superfamily N-acetyltransferase